jgi:hypothetical protein
VLGEVYLRDGVQRIFWKAKSPIHFVKALQLRIRLTIFVPISCSFSNLLTEFRKMLATTFKNLAILGLACSAIAAPVAGDEPNADMVMQKRDLSLGDLLQLIHNHTLPAVNITDLQLELNKTHPDLGRFFNGTRFDQHHVNESAEPSHAVTATSKPTASLTSHRETHSETRPTTWSSVLFSISAHSDPKPTWTTTFVKSSVSGRVTAVSTHASDSDGDGSHSLHTFASTSTRHPATATATSSALHKRHADSMYKPGGEKINGRAAKLLVA